MQTLGSWFFQSSFIGINESSPSNFWQMVTRIPNVATPTTRLARFFPRMLYLPDTATRCQYPTDLQNTRWTSLMIYQQNW